MRNCIQPLSDTSKRIALLSLLCLPSALLAAPGPQEEAAAPSRQSGGGLEEIVVTAQRKAERLQDVPIAVNVLSGDALATMGAVETRQLGIMVPSLDIGLQGSGGTPYLRGVGSNATNPNDEPSVAMYVDGVYLAAPFTTLMNFNNIERIEVLKGPQGTLFGRNATGGVIQLITRDPKQEPGLEASVGYANYDTTSASLYATGGPTDWFAADLAVQYENQRDGWGENLGTGNDANLAKYYSVRTKLLFTPSDETQIRVSADYLDRDGIAVEYRLPQGVLGRGGPTGTEGVLTPGGKYDTPTNIQVYNYGDNRNVVYARGASVRLDQKTGLGQLVSISAWRKGTGCLCVDTDGYAIQWTEALLPLYMQSFSQELQLIAPENSSVDWLVGLFLFDNTAKYGPDALITGIDPALAGGASPYGKQKTQSGSLYAQATFPVWTDTKLTTGLRYTTEEQKFYSSITLPALGVFIPFDRAKNKMDEPTWRIAIDHAFTPDIHAYVSYNRGIKSGGFDLLTGGSQGYDPEFLDAYEVGVKSELFGRRLRFNASVFYYDYKDIQVQAIPQFTIETTNAAKAHIQGIDVDFQAAVTNALTLSGGFAVLDSEYEKYDTAVIFPASPFEGPPIPNSDVSGNETVHNPKFTGSLAADYRIRAAGGEVALSANYYYNDGFYYAADNRFKQDSYGLINAAVKWTSPDDVYTVQLWGRNLADKYYNSGGVPTGFGDLITPAPPRTYGITLGAKF